MTLPILITAASESVAVTSTAATLATDLTDTGQPGDYVYAFSANTDCWILQSASPTATAGNGSVFVPAGAIILLDGSNGAAVSVIRDSADGAASLTPVAFPR